MNHLAELIKEKLEPGDAVMVNGTSIEVALELLQTSKLFGKRFINHADYPGYVFFAPNASHFNGRELSDGNSVDGIACTWDSALRSGLGYAELNAVKHYMIDRLGFYPDSLAELLIPRMIRTYKVFYREMRQKGFKPKTLSQLLRNAYKRKGVLIGTNERIFERRTEIGKDDSHSVCIYAPNGIELKYVNSIVPCGQIERQMLSEFFSR